MHNEKKYEYFYNVLQISLHIYFVKVHLRMFLILHVRNFFLLIVSLGFYDDVYIRRDSMMTNSHYDETERSWVWDYQTEDETHHLYMDIGMY